MNGAETLTNKTADHRSHRFYRLTCLCLFRPAGLYGRCAGRNKKTLDSIQDVISAECHLEDREQVNDLIQTNRPDYILHLAGKIQLESWKHPASYMESNVMGTIYLLEAVRRLSGQSHGDGWIQTKRRSRKGAAAVPHPYSLSKTFASWSARPGTACLTSISSLLSRPI